MDCYSLIGSFNESTSEVIFQNVTFNPYNFGYFNNLGNPLLILNSNNVMWSTDTASCLLLSSSEYRFQLTFNFIIGVGESTTYDVYPFIHVEGLEFEGFELTLHAIRTVSSNTPSTITTSFTRFLPISNVRSGLYGVNRLTGTYQLPIFDSNNPSRITVFTALII